MDYKLSNPRNGVKAAKISTVSQFVKLEIEWAGFNKRRLDTGQSFSSVSSAKRYFSNYYQSKNNGFEKPIWEKIN